MKTVSQNTSVQRCKPMEPMKRGNNRRTADAAFLRIDGNR
jgi:hypothetical protein